MRRSFVLWIVCSLLLVGSAQAQNLDWVASALPERSYDFGTVARGSKIRHAFPIVNRTNAEIRIAEWKTKCGCTDVRVGSKVIPPGTQTTIEATIDTTKFQGPKASGLTLVLDRPVFVSVDLNLNCFIRADIVMNPGQFDFLTVRRSAKLPSASLVLTYSGGRPDWVIDKVRTLTSKVKAKATGPTRTAAGQVQWLITADLQPEIGNGYFKDQITLVTNDDPPQLIPISVVAVLQTSVTVSPSIINFGQLKPGQTATKSVRVRSAAPFAISKLTSDRPELSPVDKQTGEQADHELTLTLKAPAAAGPYHAVVTIETGLKDEPAAMLKTFANVATGP
jgi:Protein of unknown function (DUF1573)